MKALIFLIVFNLISIQKSQTVDQYLLNITMEMTEVKGNLKVALFNDAEGFMDNAVFDTTLIITDRSMDLELNLDPDVYAVSIYQDLNENDNLDSNFFGIPTEPYGFSNNARGTFGPPTYEQCKFALDNNKSVTINLN